MQLKKFLKENLSFVALFFLLTIATATLMTACNAKVNPSSPGIATVTQTPVPPTNTPNVNITPLAVGAISFIGTTHNGNAQFGFVANQTIPTGNNIYITNLQWNGTGFNAAITSSATTQTVLEYSVNCQISAGQVIYIGNPSDVPTPTNGSVLTGISGVNFIPASGASGDHLLAFTEPASTTVNLQTGALTGGSTYYWTAGMMFSADAWGSTTNYYDSMLPSGLTLGTNAVDLSAMYTSYPAATATAFVAHANSCAYINGDSTLAIASPTTTPEGSCQSTTAGSAAFCNTNNWAGTAGGKTTFVLYGTPIANETVCPSGIGYILTPSAAVSEVAY